MARVQERFSLGTGTSLSTCLEPMLVSPGVPHLLVLLMLPAHIFSPRAPKLYFLRVTGSNLSTYFTPCRVSEAEASDATCSWQRQGRPGRRSVPGVSCCSYSGCFASTVACIHFTAFLSASHFGQPQAAMLQTRTCLETETESREAP